MSKEHPILFSADMVNAIIAGNKMQTRRVIKPQPIEMPVTLEGHSGVTLFRPKKDNAMQGVHESWLKQGRLHHWKCKYGKIGDKLWVRETWRTYASLDDISPCNIVTGAGIQYEALGTNLPNDKGDYLFGMGKCRPSIHMPRWASRILLEITDIRVERLNDISESDAIAEGIEKHQTGLWLLCAEKGKAHIDPRRAYRDLWERINGEGLWSQNPFVFVISFKRI